MQVVILAAGIGSRLAGEEGPKALVPLGNGTTILDWQLSMFEKSLDLNTIHIVVGYRSKTVEAIYPALNSIKNPDYASTNTAKSLLCALNQLGTHEDILWINGDVVFHHSVLPPLLKSTTSCMLVNEAEVGEEEIKYRCNAKGFIAEISKQVRAPVGEAVGINHFTSLDLPRLHQALEDCEPNDYFERAVQMCINDGMTITPIRSKTDRSVEIDFPEDLKHANQLLSTWANEGEQAPSHES